MACKFNSVTNQLPQSSINNSDSRKLSKLKAGETTADLNSVFEIDSYTDNIYVVKRPTEDSLPNAQLMFSAAQVESGKTFNAGMLEPRWVAFDTSNGTPSVGDDVGTKADSYKMVKDNTGFKCVAYNATEGLCLVRPFSAGDAKTTATVINDGYINLTTPDYNAPGTWQTAWSNLTYPFECNSTESYSLHCPGFFAGYHTAFAANIIIPAGTTPPGTVTILQHVDFADSSDNIIFQSDQFLQGKEQIIAGGLDDTTQTTIRLFANAIQKQVYLGTCAGVSGETKTIARVRFRYTVILSSFIVLGTGSNITGRIGATSGTQVSIYQGIVDDSYNVVTPT